MINAGGIIRVACEYLRQGSESLRTHVVADRLAERTLHAPATTSRPELPRLRHAHR